jgi:predicted nucleic acid-binding protein
VAVVVDTSVVVAAMRRRDADHEAVAGWLRGVTEPLLTTPLAAAEMDHFAQRLGDAFVDGLWGDFESGAYDVRWWPGALGQTLALARAHPGIGLTDASLAALASAVGATAVATLDHRHFRRLSDAGGRPLVLLPADAEMA